MLSIFSKVNASCLLATNQQANALRNAVQAILQMMTDDWSAVYAEDWDLPARPLDWRTKRFQTEKALAAADDSSTIDIEGMPALRLSEQPDSCMTTMPDYRVAAEHLHF